MVLEVQVDKMDGSLLMVANESQAVGARWRSDSGLSPSHDKSARVGLVTYKNTQV